MHHEVAGLEAEPGDALQDDGLARRIEDLVLVSGPTDGVGIQPSTDGAETLGVEGEK